MSGHHTLSKNAHSTVKALSAYIRLPKLHARDAASDMNRKITLARKLSVIRHFGFKRLLNEN